MTVRKSANATEPEPVVAWATDCRDKYAAKSDNPQDKTWPGNHDSGYAGRICMADGNLAWAAVVSDGAGGSGEGLKISALAVQAFVAAVGGSSLAELSDAASRDRWLRGWTKTLHEEAWGRFKGGYATFCGAVVLPPQRGGGLQTAVDEGGADAACGPPSVNAPGWTLFTLNVGDSHIMKLTGDGKCMGIVPDAPPNNANIEGHNPIRVVGKEPKAGFCLLDAEEFPLPKEGPCWILAGSDGFFSKKKGKDELTVFSASDMRETCMAPGVPFHEMPSRAIARSLANARKLDAAEMMDNATVAMLGFRVPATDLRGATVQSEVGLPGEPQKPGGDSSPRPVAAPQPAEPNPGTAVRNPGVSRQMIVVAAAVATAAGVILGALLFGGSADSGGDRPAEAHSGVEPGTPSPVVPDNVILPQRGLCPHCSKLRAEGKLPASENPFHWASECRRFPEGTTAESGAL